ncbi:ABC transporter permease [Treponema pedis]|uniref:ABC transporter permease n=1 Tax=Treponema pedis TaxID=409322 RepID=UPI00197F8CFC|nr:ABC transporter permease [Treponema pedis]QSI05601.1 ABC transporter permease [Treponema pedis]
MIKRDSFDRFLEFWSEFKKEKIGLVALCLFATLIILIIFEPLILPFREVNGNWHNISYWEDNPASAPPVWSELFSSKKSARTEYILDPTITEENTPQFGQAKVYSFTYNYKYDRPPNNVVFRAELNGNMIIGIEVIRPDGSVIDFEAFQKGGMDNFHFRNTVLTDARSTMQQFAQSYGASPSSGSASPVVLLFSEANRTMYRDKKPLRGEYIFKLIVPKDALNNPKNKIENPRVIIPGSVSGFLGTDINKRDVFSGIIAGLKWALFIGLIASIVSVFVGVIYGIISAYLGGYVDVSMMFIFEIFVSVPLIPVLIVTSSIFKPSIWIIILSLIIFSWVGSVKTVRSMALQIKEETYIEAAKALGATKWRIIFKHITPLLLPYSFALMASSVPGAILTESSLSLLGLGDPTIVTWGQILHDAQVSGAALNGLWWWIIPPGLFIALMGMIFAFLGFAMDKILHPKLKTR